MTKPRPGGRSARIKAATIEAAAALVAQKGHDGFTMTDVAERAGVAVTSLYRRWGDVRALVLEVAVEQLMREHPLPDTGSLRGDLTAWGRSLAASLNQPGGSSFFRAFVATAPPIAEVDPARTTSLGQRLRQVASMLERAIARGEAAPPVADVMDHLLAPLYIRALFGAPATEAFADHLVERLLR